MRWTLAGLSAGGAAGVVAALLTHQVLVRIVVPATGPVPLWTELVVRSGGIVATVWAIAMVYRIVLRYGAKLAGEGRERPGLALVIGVAPWLALFLWIALVVAL